MKKLLLVTACCFGCISSSFAQETVTIADKEYEITTIIDRDLGPGIHYNRLRLGKFPLNVNLLRVDLTNPYNSVETTQANDRLYGTEGLVSAAKRQTSPGHVAIAGANANFWCVSSQPPFSDVLIGLTYNGNLRNGKIISETNCHSDQWDNGPSHTGIVGITPDKKAISSNNYRWQGVVRSANAGAAEFFTVNKTVRPNEMCLYNSYHGATRAFRPVNQEGSHFVAANNVSTEAYLTLDEGQEWATAKDITFVVKEIKSNAGDGCVGDYDAVLVGRDAFAEYLNKLTVGEKITINTAWTDPAGNPVEFTNLVGGNAQVLLDNELLSANDTETYNSQVYSRTGYGTNDDGTTLYIIVIDKATDPVYGSSAGCNTRAMCAIAQHYGCTNMTNFDAGGSAQMFVMDRIINKTTESSPRAVANGMLAYSIAPVDNEVARLEFYDYSLSAPIYSSFTPRIIAYNKYGAMLTDDFKDFTLSCPAEAGTCQGSRFTAGATAGESTVTATAGNVTVTKPVSIIEAQPQIRIKPELVIDAARKYAMEVNATVGANSYSYNPADINWTMAEEGIAALDSNGVLTGIKNGTVQLTGNIGEFTDATTVSVEISDAAGKNIFTDTQDPAQWKATNTALSDLAVSALGSNGGIAIDYTVKNARATRATVARDMRVFSLPDAIEVDINPGQATIKQLQLTLKTANNSRNTAITKDVTLTPDAVNTVSFDISEFGDNTDLIMFPVTFKSLSILIGDKVGTASHVEFPAIRAVYNNYQAGVDDITADDANDSAAAVYYDLQGRKISGSNLHPGLYLRHSAGTTTKVIVK